MAIAIFNDPDYVCSYGMKQEDTVSVDFHKTVGKKNAYIRLNLETNAFAFPYRLDSDLGTFSHIGFNNDFTATLVKGISFDKDRFFSEVKVRAERDLAAYKMLQKAFPNDYIKMMPFYNLARFRGDDERFNGTEEETQEQLFYWNLTEALRESTIFLKNKKNISYDYNYGEDESRVKAAIEYGQKVEKLFRNLDDNDWLAVFSIDE